MKTREEVDKSGPAGSAGPHCGDWSKMTEEERVKASEEWAKHGPGGFMGPKFPGWSKMTEEERVKAREEWAKYGPGGFVGPKFPGWSKMTEEERVKAREELAKHGPGGFMGPRFPDWSKMTEAERVKAREEWAKHGPGRFMGPRFSEWSKMTEEERTKAREAWAARGGPTFPDWSKMTDEERKKARQEWAKRGPGFFGPGAALFVVTCTAPIERVKILMQVCSASRTMGSEAGYRSMTQTFSRCVSQQGVVSLWRGYSAMLLLHLPSQAITFGLRDVFWRSMFRGGEVNQHRFRYFMSSWVSGAAAGTAALTAVYPLGFCRTRLAADVGVAEKREFTGLWNCLKNIYKSDGIRGLYRGFTIAVQGVILYRGLYIGLFDLVTAKRGLHNQHLAATWMTGSVLAVVAGVASYPLEVLHRQMQMQSGPNHKTFSGAVECMKTIAKTEGYRGFYRGFLASVLCGIVANTLYVGFRFATRPH